MNKLFYWGILLFLWIPASLFAQQTKGVSISGIVMEKETKEPVIQATVRLLQLPDSTFKTGTFTDYAGAFTIKGVSGGNYILQITYLGFETLSKPVKVTDADVKLSGMEMIPGSTMLKEAVVVGYATDVIVKQDTIEYNADSFKVPPGSVAEDLLKRLPGVEIDSDGKITVAGKEIKKIYVDGKEFFAGDPKVATKNLPTNIINKLQVVDKKSDLAQLTGIDDGDDEKIINITIKPGMKKGWFGNAVLGGGTKIDDENRYEASGMINRFEDKTRISLLGSANNTNNQGFSDLGGDLIPQMNVRGRGRRQSNFSGSNGINQSGTLGLNVNNTFSDKLTLDGSVAYGHSSSKVYSGSQTQNILKDSVFFTTDTTVNRNVGNNLAAQINMEYKPDSLTQINFKPQASYNTTTASEIGYTDTRDGSPMRALVNRSNSSAFTDGDGYNISGTLDVSRGSRTKKGRKMTVSLTGGITNGSSDGKNDSETAYFDPQTGAIRKNSIIDQIQDNKNYGYNYRLYASFVEPVFTNRFLQLSYSYRVNDNDTRRNTFSRDSVTQEYTVLDSAYSRSFRNHFINQQINVSLRTVREKYDYSVGLEVSPSKSTSERYIGDTILQKLSRSVVNFAPTVSLSYRFDKQRNMRIEYRGQTAQPSITQLDPTVDLSNPLNIRYGNPDLKPSYTHQLYFRYNDYNRERQQSLNINGNFSYILNSITNFGVYDSSGVRTTYPVNVSGNWNARLQAFYNTPLKNPKFRVNSNFTATYNNTQGYANGLDNTSRVLGLNEIAGISFRSTILNLGTRFSIRYSNTDNTLEGQQNQSTADYGIGGDLSINLPLNVVLASDINYTGRSGYSTGYSQNEVIWNAEVSTRFLKNNQATVKFKIYDILQDRKNITRTISANAITDSQYNTLTSYCMLYFIYSFNAFGSGNQSGESRNNRSYGGERRGRGGPSTDLF